MRNILILGFVVTVIFFICNVNIVKTTDLAKLNIEALSANEMTDAQMVLGMPRLEARVRLEAYVLLASIVGKIKWSNPNHWYWVGKDKDFIILNSLEHLFFQAFHLYALYNPLVL